MYSVYRNQAAAACSFLYFFIFFLFNFQTLKIFVTLFSGTVTPRRLKLGTHMTMGGCIMYRNRAAAAYLSLYFSFFFLSNFQTLKNNLSHFSQEL